MDQYYVLARALDDERAKRPQEAVALLSALLTHEYEENAGDWRADFLPVLVRPALESGGPQSAHKAAAACRPDAEREPVPRKLGLADRCQGVLDAAPRRRRRPTPGTPTGCACRQHAGGRRHGLRVGRGPCRGARGTEADSFFGGAVCDARRAAARLRAYGVRASALLPVGGLSP
ncbi:hypothetical protein [Streptomyces sp. NPDC048527]|uniref:hypothetical protein n=1 Tax=Streptomyces sp. NPDC048527 TaxID=3365568 RepID=UPI0037218B6D